MFREKHAFSRQVMIVAEAVNQNLDLSRQIRQTSNPQIKKSLGSENGWAKFDGCMSMITMESSRAAKSQTNLGVL